ncbi:MAG: cupredoxin domain-containing protein [Acidimicrobiales bacterium]
MARTWGAPLAALVAVVVGACGSSGGSGGTVKAAADPGRPAAVAPTNRVVQITMLPKHFDPSTVAAKVGETVTFRLVNSDTTYHEFTIGDATTQAAREKEMTAMGPTPMGMADRPYSVTLAGGQTKELAWTFISKGAVTYADHEPGNFAAGMKGTVTVS